MGDIDMIEVCDPRKQYEFTLSTAGGRIKSAYTEYKIMVSRTISGPDSGTASYRRFSDFAFLHEVLLKRIPGAVLPALPEKSVQVKFSVEHEKSFTEARARALTTYLQLLCSNGEALAEVASVKQLFEVFLFGDAEAWANCKDRASSLCPEAAYAPKKEAISTGDKAKTGRAARKEKRGQEGDGTEIKPRGFSSFGASSMSSAGESAGNDGGGEGGDDRSSGNEESERGGSSLVDGGRDAESVQASSSPPPSTGASSKGSSSSSMFGGFSKMVSSAASAASKTIANSASSSSSAKVEESEKSEDDLQLEKILLETRQELGLVVDLDKKSRAFIALDGPAAWKPVIRSAQNIVDRANGVLPGKGKKKKTPEEGVDVGAPITDEDPPNDDGAAAAAGGLDSGGGEVEDEDRDTDDASHVSVPAVAVPEVAGGVEEEVRAMLLPFTMMLENQASTFKSAVDGAATRRSVCLDPVAMHIMTLQCIKVAIEKRNGVRKQWIAAAKAHEAKKRELQRAYDNPKTTAEQRLELEEQVDWAAQAREDAAVKTKAATARFLRDHARATNAKLFSFKQVLLVWAKMTVAQCRAAQADMRILNDMISSSSPSSQGSNFASGNFSAEEAKAYFGATAATTSPSPTAAPAPAAATPAESVAPPSAPFPISANEGGVDAATPASAAEQKEEIVASTSSPAAIGSGGGFIGADTQPSEAAAAATAAAEETPGDPAVAPTPSVLPEEPVQVAPASTRGTETEELEDVRLSGALAAPEVEDVTTTTPPLPTSATTTAQDSAEEAAEASGGVERTEGSGDELVKLAAPESAPSSRIEEVTEPTEVAQASSAEVAVTVAEEVAGGDEESV